MKLLERVKLRVTERVMEEVGEFERVGVIVGLWEEVTLSVALGVRVPMAGDRVMVGEIVGLREVVIVLDGAPLTVLDTLPLPVPVKKAEGEGVAVALEENVGAVGAAVEESVPVKVTVTVTV